MTDRSTFSLGIVVVILVLVGVAVAVPTLLRTAPSPSHSTTPTPSTRGPASSSGAPLVTPRVARQVTTRVWGLWQEALSENDTKLLATVDAPGVQLEDDSSDCGRVASKYRLFIPCRPLPLLAMSLVVPVQHRYPVDFLAQVRTRQRATTSYGIQPQTLNESLVLLVITRRGPEAPWQIAFRTTYFGVDPAHVPFLAVPTTAGGFDEQAPVASSATLSGLPGLLGAYYQSCWTTGSPPPGTDFIPGPYTTAWCKQIGTVHAAGKSVQYSATPPANGLWTFGIGVRGFVEGSLTVRTPWAMVCSLVNVTVSFVPANGNQAVVQTATQIQFGPGLESGEYTKVVESENHDVCILTDGRAMSVLGDSGTTYRFSDTAISVTGDTGQHENAGTIPLRKPR